MYVPKLYAITDKQRSYDFIRDNGFGILFSHQGSGPVASHLPFILSEEPDGQDFLLGHMARANDHWRHADGNEVMVVFHGPHAYVSPTWYGEPDTVPTWNYAVVHVYGAFEALHDREGRRGCRSTGGRLLRVLPASTLESRLSIPPTTVR